MARFVLEGESRVEEVIHALNQVDAKLGTAQQTSEKARGGFGGLGLSLTDLKSGIDLASQAFRLAGQAIDATVTPTLELARQQRDLARTSGSTAEEAGALIQVADDLTVSYDTLKTASKTLTREGLSLNLETLEQLSAEYQALPGPVERSQFVAEKFGARAGPEMQKLLELSTTELRAMGSAALDSGLVLSGPAVASARQYEMAQDSLNDALTAAKVTIGAELIPVLTQLANMTATAVVPATQQASQIWQQANTSAWQLQAVAKILALRFQEGVGALDANTSAARQWLAATEASRLAEADTTSALDAHERQLQATTTALEESADVTDASETQTREYETATTDAERALADLQSRQQGWASGVGNDVIQALDQAGIEGQEYLAALVAVDTFLGTSFATDEQKERELQAIADAYQRGELTAGEFQAKLKELYETDMPRLGEASTEAERRQAELESRFGEVAAAAEFAGNFVGGLAGAIDALRSKRVTITTVHRDIFETEEAIAAAEGTEVTPGEAEVTPTSGAFQHGGSFVVPGSGGPDSQLVQFLATPGEPVTVGTPTALPATGETTIVFNIYEVRSPLYTAAIVQEQLARLLNLTDARRRLGY